MMKDAGLGRGLSELLGDNLDCVNHNDRAVQRISLSLIEPGKYQPRRCIEEKELIELASSIIEKGVLQPILVKFNNILHKYEIIAGERRYRASVKAGLKDIPAMVLEISDQEAYELALIENIQREKLDVLEEAYAIAKLSEKYDVTQDEIARKLGKSRTHVTNILRLLTLPQEVQDMLSAGEITMGHARALVNKKDAVELAKLIVKNGLSVRQTEEMVKAETKEKREIISQYDSQKQGYLDQISSELTNLLNLKTKIKHKNNKGNITIQFKNTQEMDYLIDIFEYYVANHQEVDE